MFVNAARKLRTQFPGAAAAAVATSVPALPSAGY